MELISIRFVPEKDTAGRRVVRRFTSPRTMVAIEERAESAEKPAWPEPLDHLLIARTLPVANWLAAPDNPDAPQAFLLQLERGSIRWRPGRAVVEGASPHLTAGLIDFAFHEGELRRLEQALLPFEKTALDDVALAYRIQGSSKAEWARLGETMESLSRLRLEYARLEPHLVSPDRSLDQQARRVAARMAARAGVPARLEAFSNRLEACEDLYEGAVDRIADFRWYSHGELLEIIIVVLLVVETIVMTLGLFRKGA